MSHGNDCHWNSVHCRKCRIFVTEWYDKDFGSEPDDICDSCARDEGKWKGDKLLIEKLKTKLHEMIVKYEPKRCWRCHAILSLPDKSWRTSSLLGFGQEEKDLFTPYSDDPYEVCNKCSSYDPYTDW
jgi:hypothetical protein